MTPPPPIPAPPARGRRLPIRPAAYPPAGTEAPAALKELTGVPGVGPGAHAQNLQAELGALVKWATGRREVRKDEPEQALDPLAPTRPRGRGQAFGGTSRHLQRMPPWAGRESSEATIRSDRDSRG